MPIVLRNGKRLAFVPVENAAAKKSKALKSKPLNLIDLPTESILDICDYLDIETMCALAATCSNLQDIAHESLKFRKVSGCWFSNEERNRISTNGNLLISNERLMIDILQRFGGLFKFFRWFSNRDNNQRLCENLVSNCSGTLQVLWIDDIETKDVNWIPLFMHLKELRIGSSVKNPSKYPFHVCKQLEALIISSKNDELLKELFSIRFPSLNRLELCRSGVPESLLIEFVSMHPKLTYLGNFVDDHLSEVITYVPQLEKLCWIQSFTNILYNVSKMPLKYFGMTDIWELDKFHKFSKVESIFCQNVEVLYVKLWCSTEDSNRLDMIWSNLAKWRKLQVLRIRLYDYDINDMVAVVKKILVKLTNIALIEMPCYARKIIGNFERHEYSSCGKISVLVRKPHSNYVTFSRNGCKLDFDRYFLDRCD